MGLKIGVNVCEGEDENKTKRRQACAACLGSYSVVAAEDSKKESKQALNACLGSKICVMVKMKAQSRW